jgi:hypothetical protein
MLAKKVRAKSSLKSALKSLSEIKLSNPVKITLGIGLAAVAGYFGYKIFKETF